MLRRECSCSSISHLINSCLCFLGCRLGGRRERVVGAALLAKLLKLFDSLVQWHRLATVLAGGIVTVSDVDLSTLHLLVADDENEVVLATKISKQLRGDADQI